jgi:hypothetical protein
MIKHTPEAMRAMADLVSYPSLSLDDIRNRAAAMLRDIADEVEADHIVDANKMVSATNYPEIPEGWQTIDTAPKDGTTIILACGNRVTVGDWISPEMVNNWDGDDFDAHWQSWDGGFINESEHSATHWMPLPAAPSPKGNV